MDEREVIAGLDEEEQKRLEKIAKLDANQKRKKVIFGAVTVALIAMFFAGTVFGAKYILSNEGTMPLPQGDYAPVQETPDDIFAEVNRLIADTEQYDSVKLNSRFRFRIDGDSLAVTGETADEALLRYVKGSVEDRLSDLYSENGHTGEFGEDFSPYLPDFDFTEADVKEIVFAPKEDDDGRLVASFTFDGCDYSALPGTKVCEIFALEDLSATVEQAKAAFADDMTVNAIDIAYDDFKIEANISRSVENDGETRELNSLVYLREGTVTLGVTFTGNLAAFGEQAISFRIACSEDYSFDRIRFRITSHAHFIEKGASDEISHRVNSDQSVSDYVIRWESSDPEILSVDEDGFYKGKAVSDKPVTVTGTYVYNGHEYSDTCLFYVRKPVKSVKLSETELTMAPGEETTLEPLVRPDDATFKDVYWFSTDESIVTVEDGVVKAVAPGQAGVYVITLDGNYKKTCQITVEG
ncbi:MAG: Ig domain-containing protein [Clostridia bacterium]|nr:Ig domain-containing protein [Clostridia bacterium]